MPHESKTHPAPGAPARSQRSPEELASQFEQLAQEALPASLGFSARLNMLWDLSGVVPAQAEGRVLAVLGINSCWRETEVRKWLQKDILPPPLDLRNMVSFLLAQMDEAQDVSRWEAFLIYGSPVVSSPVNASMYRQDQARREIASLIFAQLTDEYGIAPSAYDADKAFQRCLTLMHKFNIYELQDFQPGHLEPFRNYMFPVE
ncbi:hypothetical protein GCM10007052_08130 [Halioglobus japonicus]|uniref:Uncharacterized protein n=1 Tax=Halioglobus japonicus TaxID=930805 RepID=A0AAP8SPI8_9GAMM|nr:MULTISPECIES: hypothetical protein [Halioglobus]KZX59451.1 hypothetical protein A3709_14240 [Halioglobus sp. HI00S01]PLW87198.1 hypothetical protein C0029_00960 [Halioglobus japonicus]GHD09705.1 hypothetical protein GCM10007052_08130 [Halioglobus japonicus]